MIISPGSWCTQDFVCALQECSLCFPKSCKILVIKSHWPSKSDFLGIPNPYARSLGWEARHGTQNFHNSRRISLIFLYGLCVTHPAEIGFDFIVTALPTISRGFFLVFGCGYLFLVGSNALLSMVVQQLVAILVLSWEEMSTHFSTLPSWTPYFKTQLTCADSLLLVALVLKDLHLLK